MGYKTNRQYDINERLKKIIIENDKKPTAIADKSKIRRDTFSRILHNQRPIYADEIPSICKALNISIGYLFGEEATMYEGTGHKSEFKCI